MSQVLKQKALPLGYRELKSQVCGWTLEKAILWLSFELSPT